MLKCNIFRSKTRQKVLMAFERCPFEISTNFYFLVDFIKKSERGVAKLQVSLFGKKCPFLTTGAALIF